MVISQDTKITLGATFAAISFCMGGAWWLSTEIQGLRADFRLMTNRMEMNEATLPKLYSISAACEHALRLAMENPGMRVPDPRDPNNIIVVRSAVTK